MFKILMIFYQFVINTADFLYFIYLSVLHILKSLWYLVDPPKLKSVTGETIMITGTGRGLGKQLAVQFARLGANIVAVDNNEELVNETVSIITKEGGTANGFVCDVSHYNEVQTLSKKIRSEVGEITVLVNNVGTMPCKKFLSFNPKEIESIFKNNVYSHYWTVMEWLPYFLKRKHGHIVAVSSICGLAGAANLVPFCSTKHAIAGMMNALFEEIRYGNLNPNVKFTTVYPFIVSTGLAELTRVRFPSFISSLPVEECAEKIIECMRRDLNSCIIPYKHEYFFKIYSLLPRKIQLAFMDFLDTGVDELSMDNNN